MKNTNICFFVATIISLFLHVQIHSTNPHDQPKVITVPRSCLKNAFFTDDGKGNMFLNPDAHKGTIIKHYSQEDPTKCDQYTIEKKLSTPLKTNADNTQEADYLFELLKMTAPGAPYEQIIYAMNLKFSPENNQVLAIKEAQNSGMKQQIAAIHQKKIADYSFRNMIIDNELELFRCYGLNTTNSLTFTGDAQKAVGNIFRVVFDTNIQTINQDEDQRTIVIENDARNVEPHTILFNVVELFKKVIAFTQTRTNSGEYGAGSVHVVTTKKITKNDIQYKKQPTLLAYGLITTAAVAAVAGAWQLYSWLKRA